MAGVGPVGISMEPTIIGGALPSARVQAWRMAWAPHRDVSSGIGTSIVAAPSASVTNMPITLLGEPKVSQPRTGIGVSAFIASNM